MRGERDAEIVGGAEPQLGIDARAAARVEQRLLGTLVITGRELGDTVVVRDARLAVLAGASGDDEAGDDRDPDHGALRSPAPAPTHSDASRNRSEASTNQMNCSAGITRTEASAAARTIGWT